MKPALFFAALAFVCHGQVPAQSTGPADARGACSPANTGNNNRFNITCGIGKEQGAELLKIVNKILANQGDSLRDFGDKLDEILRGVKDIKNASAPRTISDAGVRRLLEVLSPFPGEKVSLTFLASDNETASLASRLQAILRAARWDTGQGMSSATFFADGPLFGIEVTAKENTPAALALLNGLHAILPDVAGRLNPKNPDGRINITVYSKR